MRKFNIGKSYSIGNILVRKKIHFYAVIIVVFVVVSAVLLFFTYNLISGNESILAGNKNRAVEIKPSSELLSLSIEMTQKDAGSVQPDINAVRRAIDGVYVPIGSENIYPIAVMIDNSVYARPHSSLARANLVYEAEVEGGVTRYMAIFAGREDIDEIGPVRSARPYFVDWAEEISALYAHVGGSPAALVKIKKDNVEDINEFYNGKYFWRDWNRGAPHNVYTSGEFLNKYKEARLLTEVEFTSWLYKNDFEEEGRGEDDVAVKIKYSLANFKISWKYDRISNSYVRYVVNRAHVDKSGEGITAKNIIIQYVIAKEIDNLLRLEMKHIGSGKVVLCLDGYCGEGSWEKKNTSSRTRFYDENGNEAIFNAGKTWVQVVRPGISVEY